MPSRPSQPLARKPGGAPRRREHAEAFARAGGGLGYGCEHTARTATAYGGVHDADVAPDRGRGGGRLRWADWTHAGGGAGACHAWTSTGRLALVPQHRNQYTRPAPPSACCGGGALDRVMLASFSDRRLPGRACRPGGGHSRAERRGPLRWTRTGVPVGCRIGGAARGRRHGRLRWGPALLAYAHRLGRQVTYGPSTTG